jgi:hypothetical protein
MRAVSLAAALAVAAASPCAAAEEASPPAALDPALVATAARAPDLRARPIEVVGIAGLSDLGPDPEVQDRAQTIRSRRSWGIVSFVGAATAFTLGGFLYVGEAAANAAENTSSHLYCPRCPTKDPDYTAAYTSYGIAAGLAILGLAVWPREREYAETVELWNTRHPAAPAEWVGWAPREPPEETAPAAPP